MIVVIVEIEDEEGDEARDQAHDRHGDVVDESTFWSTAPHFDKLFRSKKIIFQTEKNLNVTVPCFVVRSPMKSFNCCCT